MRICCPECSFSREIDETKVPNTAQVATCPRCKTRFKFREVTPHEAPYEAPYEEGGAHDNMPSSHDPEYEHDYAKEDAPSRPSPSELQGKRNSYTNKANKKIEGSGLLTKISAFIEKVSSKSSQKNDSAKNSVNTSEEELYKEVPWEAPESHGYLTAFYLTIINMLGHGERFFAKATTRENIGRPIIFFLIIRTLQGFLDILWFKLFMPFFISHAPVSEATTQARALLENVSFSQIISVPFTSLITLVLLVSLVTIMQVFLSVQDISLQKNIRILCYASAGLAFSILPLVGTLVGFTWMIFASIQGIACTYNLPKSKAFIATAPAYLLLFAVMLMFAGG